MRPNRHPLDDDSAARIIGGLVHPDDAPPGYGDVAGLLTAASVLTPVDEDAAATTVAAMVETIRTGASAPGTPRRKSMLKKLLAGKALAAIGVVALTASGAAAATGSLPDPAQNVVSGAVGHVGLHIPEPGDRGHSAGHRQDGGHRPDGTTSTTAGGQDPAGDNHGSVVSDTAHQAKEDGKPVGPTVCAVASAGKCQAGDDHSDKGKGGGDDESSTTSSTVGSGDDHGNPGDEQGEGHGSQAGEDHGAPTTVTTGSLATGDDHSGKDLPSAGEDSGSNSHH
jgi:hypothetical protein